ncbi:MAG: adenylate/guanylate cyclase domain-containing protein [Anaerolineae bacterium]|nr:adenylate/guanylate cyclase domain-containing protein [Anaerolineae bacterium]
MSKNRPFRVVPLIVLLGLLLVQGFAPSWVAQVEAWTVDTRFSLRGVEQPRNPIVIVAVDEDSFRMMGDLKGENVRTWPRARWAELVRRVAAGNPRIVGVDVVFDTPGWDEGGDRALAGAMAEAGNVVLAADYERATQASYGLITLSVPLDLLARESAGMGVANFPLDPDGAIRGVGAFYEKDGDDYPTFALTVASTFAGELVVDEGDIASVGGSFPIHFRGPEGTFQTVPLYGLFADELAATGAKVAESEAVDTEIFRDTIVLVGYTTQLEQDRHQTPFGGKGGMPGVEIQANAIDTFLAGDWLHRSPTWLPAVLVGGIGLAALALLNLRRPGLGVLILLGVLAAYLTLGQALFAWAGFLLPLVAPVAAAVVVGGTALAERMVFAERDKRRLRQRFAGVMSEERLQAVMGQWENLLQAERPQKEAAVLFADVRGFTNATETLMRQGRIPEMVGFLTAYLDAMAEAVFAEGGVIYDVVGDGLMILFGVPEAFSDYALRAVRGAVRMALATEGLQAVWPLRDQRLLRMGIGVHCGPVVDALVGRGRRINYAVVGDPVNTAARIESHCKAAMEIPRSPGGQVPETVTILLSAELYDQVREHVVADESVPPFEARGKSEPLRVVRVLGLQERPKPVTVSD